MKNKTTIGVLSLGCPRNLVDSENVLGRLSLKGYPIVDIDKADIAVVNTCAFIEDAKKESIGAILDLIDLKKKGKIKKIIVYGCLAERYKESLRGQLPQVDAFVGKISLNHSLKTFNLTPKHYAYLKICEGCINNCSYCIIPNIKGKFTSLDVASVLDRVGQLDKNKISELNIIGQDITAYGLDLCHGLGLAGLLQKIIKKAKNIGWIRLLYLYPSRISDELLELIKNEPKVCKYIDLPLQHINNRILKLMHRQTTREAILRIIDGIRKKAPGAAIRTSFIVGFPSETDKEFRELMAFIKEARFERLGAFIYSREEGTKAYGLKGQLPLKIKRERLNALMLEQQKVSRKINEKLLGRTISVLIDEREQGSYLGRTQYDAPEVDGLVYVNSSKILKPGDFVPVEITDTLEYDLVAKALN
ncbi:MAG: MiaB/RimO family radical SAM methylthiotransferase [Candidatus Omnitrophica bacterium]|nr:MiaB/RimO family radical SAM methylthiotransferase [Candidatus Omnitrophota bacterium]MDD5592336.1 MiaB/RimO family radical SAM methylthiotransferase [Candidatus Omnitrophota bacterium]